MNTKKGFSLLASLVIIVVLFGTIPVIAAPEDSTLSAAKGPTPDISTAVAFDVSPALRNLAKHPPTLTEEQKQLIQRGPASADRRLSEGGNQSAADNGFSGDPALQASQVSALIAAPLLTFEGLSNQDNASAFGFQVSPPDPVGDVGPNHYVEMVNLVFAVYDKSGNRLLGPTPIGALWAGFAIADCTDPSGDPVVVYDQLVDRWILTQFTTRGPTYYNCVAISQTGDPTGAYYRYAFSSGQFFPDYPKYGVWSDSYLLTSRDFGPSNEYGISVYALEKNKMVNGVANVHMVHFFLDSATVPIYLMGDGLLPADIDGMRKPPAGSGAPIVGTMDDGYGYGAPFDALNIFEISVQWKSNPVASFNLVSQLPVASFDSVFPCRPAGSRNCIPQPGTPNTIDILSYRQRPTYRLAYRNFGTYEALVTNQSVEARPGIAGARWYELRRASGLYSLYQQGTYAPDDGVHRWMGSIAMDKNGSMALGYSVSNATTTFPGIRYTGRLGSDALGQMTLGEGVAINGSGSQRSSARWGDYTSMNVDPVDDCTFWYVNEYYQVTSAVGWQTRIASFKLPGC